MVQQQGWRFCSFMATCSVYGGRWHHFVTLEALTGGQSLTQAGSSSNPVSPSRSALRAGVLCEKAKSRLSGSPRRTLHCSRRKDQYSLTFIIAGFNIGAGGCMRKCIMTRVKTSMISLLIKWKDSQVIYFFLITSVWFFYLKCLVFFSQYPNFLLSAPISTNRHRRVRTVEDQSYTVPHQTCGGAISMAGFSRCFWNIL